MGSRERKRADRQKRKRRAAQRAEATSDVSSQKSGTPPTAAGDVGAEESFQEGLSRRSKARNQAARASLEPLAANERPTAVTVGALISVLFALVFTGSAVVAAVTSIEVRGDEPNPLPLAVFAGALWMMAWGMWKARYWAVLGFQMLLVLIMLASGLGLVQVETVLQAVGTTVLLLGSGLLFYFMIRAMARIQMPERPGER